MSKTNASTPVSPFLTAPVEQAQKACQEGLDKALYLNLDALKAASQAHLAFLGTLGQARPDHTSLSAAGEATQQYVRDVQERTVAYFQSSFALAQAVGTKLQQAIAA